VWVYRNSATLTTLFPPIRLQNNAIGAFNYHKTTMDTLYFKCRIFKIPDLFNLSVAKFMSSFENFGQPEHFTNYVCKI